jgi:hypothetical protein
VRTTTAASVPLVNLLAAASCLESFLLSLDRIVSKLGILGGLHLATPAPTLPDDADADAKKVFFDADVRPPLARPFLFPAPWRRRRRKPSTSRSMTVFIPSILSTAPRIAAFTTPSTTTRSPLVLFLRRASSSRRPAPALSPPRRPRPHPARTPRRVVGVVAHVHPSHAADVVVVAHVAVDAFDAVRVMN